MTYHKAVELSGRGDPFANSMAAPGAAPAVMPDVLAGDIERVRTNSVLEAATGIEGEYAAVRCLDDGSLSPLVS